MIKYKYLLLFLFLGLNCFSQNSKIKWGLYGKKSVEERRATFPFSEAKKVVLVAFPSPDEMYDVNVSDSINFVNLGFNIIKSFKLPESKDNYFATEIIALNQNQIDSLSHILINYKLKNDKLPDNYEVYGVGCYQPRNAILFLDSNEIVISYIEICFECIQFYQIPKETIPNFNKFSSLNKSNNMIGMIKNFFNSNGIKYGIIK